MAFPKISIGYISCIHVYCMFLQTDCLCHLDCWFVIFISGIYSSYYVAYKKKKPLEPEDFFKKIRLKSFAMQLMIFDYTFIFFKSKVVGFVIDQLH